jgi:hypothetical protein
VAGQQISGGDYFRVPLDDNAEALGQVIAIEKQALNAVACAFWPHLTSNPVAQLALPPCRSCWSRLTS